MTFVFESTQNSWASSSWEACLTFTEKQIEKEEMDSSFTPLLCPSASIYVCLKPAHCALDKSYVYKIIFNCYRHMYPAFNMLSGGMRQRLVQAHSTGTTTIRTAAKAAVFLLALWPFLGTVLLLAWLPAFLQWRVCLDFLSIPWVVLIVCLGAHPSGPALLQECSQQLGGLRREKVAPALAEVSPLAILWAKATRRVVRATLTCQLCQGG